MTEEPVYALITSSLQYCSMLHVKTSNGLAWADLKRYSPFQSLHSSEVVFFLILQLNSGIASC